MTNDKFHIQQLRDEQAIAEEKYWNAFEAGVQFAQDQFKVNSVRDYDPTLTHSDAWWASMLKQTPPAWACQSDEVYSRAVSHGMAPQVSNQTALPLVIKRKLRLAA